MGALFSYSLVASLFVMLLYPIAKQIVERSADFHLNRIFLLAALALSLFLPLLVNISGGVGHTVAVPNGIAGEVDNLPYSLDGDIMSSGAGGIQYAVVVVVIYILGVGVMIAREIACYLRLYGIIRHSRIIDMDHYSLCFLTDKRIAPFSWGRYIFMYGTEGEDISDEIFLHEKSHIEHRHWIDVLFCDLMCILLWYNPFVWKTRNLVKLNHEFQADSNVIASGINPYAYQCLLIATAIDRNEPGVANCFGPDRKGFRKRILAIGRTPSSRKKLLVSLWALPALAAGVFVISMSLSSRLLKDISMTNVISAIESVKTGGTNIEARKGGEANPMAEFVGGEAALYDFLIRNTVYPDKEAGETPRKVRVLFDVTKEGHIANIRVKNPKGEIVENEACRVVKLTEGKWKPALKDGQPVDCSMQIPFYFMTR